MKMWVEQEDDYKNIIADIPIGGVFMMGDYYYIKTNASDKDDFGTCLIVCVDIESGETEKLYASETVTPLCAKCTVHRKALIEGVKSYDLSG